MTDKESRAKRSPRNRKDHNPRYKLAKVFSKTIKVGDCLEWTGSFYKKYKKGKEYWNYPEIYYLGRSRRGNRLVWELINGPIENNLLILHKCNNPKCLNPDHLYAGTSAQNVKDSINAKTHSSLKRKSNGTFA